MFYTIEIPNIFQLYPKKHIYCDIFGKKLRMVDVLKIYIEKIVSFVHSFTPMQTHTIYFVKTLTWIWQILQNGLNISR